MNTVDALKCADRVEVVTLMDNYVDLLLPGSDVVTRPALTKDGEVSSDTLLAEHGLSLLITVFSGEKRHTVLFDTGYSSVGVAHNMKVLGIDPAQIGAIVLSHGHMDHTGCISWCVERVRPTSVLAFHPDVFLFPRFVRMDNGETFQFPRTLDRSALQASGMTLLETTDPTLIAGDTVLVSGEIPRVTSFEKGMPNAFCSRDGSTVKDTIADDQALVLRLKDKGLVVISGCSHAGIINTLMRARDLTGEERVHAVMGGFHLTGPHFAPIADETIEALKEFNPAVLVPMHCTGWYAIGRFSEEFPFSFVLNSVGSRYTLT